MKKTIFLTILTLLFMTNAYADHGPKIQFIHNSPAESVASVDLWYNWTNWDEIFAPTKIAESFDYKKATPFSTYTLVYGDLIIYVTPEGSSDTTNYLFKKTFGQPQIDYDETFVVVLAGIPGNDFNLVLNDGQLESAHSFNTDVSIFHGSPDAPAVDIVETSVPAGTLVSNLEYKESSDYLSLDPLDYVLQVQTTEGIGVAEFDVPLSSFAGEALFVAATGYLDTQGNNTNAPFKLIAAKSDGSVIEFDPNEISTTARVQVIHNSADAAAEVVDVWLNETLLLDDFAFKTASPFVDAPAGEEFTIAIKGPDSQNPDDPIWSQNYTLAADETYILVADGIVSDSGYDPNQPFDIQVYDMARETAESGENTEVLVHHGSTDTPTIDVVDIGVGYGTIVNDISYSEFDGYLELITSDDYILNLFNNVSGTFASFEAPLSTLGLEGEAITIVASGFMNPENNSDGAPLGLWVSLSTGGELVELQSIPVPPVANTYFQVIHNSADENAEIVDVWLDNILILDDFEFRTASPLFGTNAEEEFTLAIKGPDSQSPEDPIWSMDYTLEEDKNYILIAEGIVSSSGYDPMTPFDIAVYDMGRDSANMMGNTDLLVHHGSTDAPTVDIYETGVGAGELVDDLSYSEFAGYLELAAMDYTLEVRDETGTNTVAAYSAPLSTLGLDNQAITVVASGFLNPDNNSGGPEFGLWVALPFGGPLLPLPVYNETQNALVQFIHNSPDDAAQTVDIWMDDQMMMDDMEFRSSSSFIEMPAGVEFTLAVKDQNSQNSENPVWWNTYELEADETYILVADGLINAAGYDAFEPFDISVYPMGREMAGQPENTDVLVHHGSVDAPTVDIYEVGVGAGEIVDDLMYMDFDGYLELSTMDYILQIRDETGTTAIAAFDAPLATLGLEGQAITVVASGFLNPEDNNNGPTFGLFVALADGGGLAELPVNTTVGFEESIFVESSFEVFPNPVVNEVKINLELAETQNVNIEVFDMMGKMIKSRDLGLQQSLNNISLNMGDISEGIYFLRMNAGVSDITKKIVISR